MLASLLQIGWKKPKQLKKNSFAYAKLFPFTAFIVLSLSMDL